MGNQPSSTEEEKEGAGTTAQGTLQPGATPDTGPPAKPDKPEVTTDSLFREYNGLVPTAIELGIEARTRVTPFLNRADAARYVEGLRAKIAQARKEKGVSGSTLTRAGTVPAQQTKPASGKNAGASQKAAPAGEATGEDTMADRRKRPTGRKTAKKTKTAAKRGAARGRASKYAEDAKITVSFKENPRREGSARHKDYEIMKRHGTVAGYLKAGGTRSGLNSAVRRKHAKVA
jgi:hypothetical protein